MTDITILHNLQSEAVKLLLDETFTYIETTMKERYTALGKLNAQLLNVPDVRFTSKGVIYPPHVVPTIPYGSRIPTLHYSLLNELDTINNAMAQADYGYIKNFFVAVISQSHNDIVLSELLPAVLINLLKTHMPVSNFKIVDSGICGGLQQEPINVTKQNIQDIKHHYRSTIESLQYLLMDKFLLQS